MRQVYFYLSLVAFLLVAQASYLSEMRIGLGSSLFASRYLGNNNCYFLLRLLKCFTSAGSLPLIAQRIIEVYSIGFPHSEIPGSQVATHLTEAYRCYATSFIAFSSQGIHHSPLFPSCDGLPTIPILTFSNATHWIRIDANFVRFAHSLINTNEFRSNN